MHRFVRGKQVRDQIAYGRQHFEQFKWERVGLGKNLGRSTRQRLDRPLVRSPARLTRPLSSDRGTARPATANRDQTACPSFRNATRLTDKLGNPVAGAGIQDPGGMMYAGQRLIC